MKFKDDVVIMWGPPHEATSQVKVKVPSGKSNGPQVVGDKSGKSLISVGSPRTSKKGFKNQF